jgi:hypothetical protein
LIRVCFPPRRRHHHSQFHCEFFLRLFPDGLISFGLLRGAWIKEQKINITNGKATEYQVAMILTFILDGGNGDEDNGKSGSGKSSKGKKR